MPVTRLDVAPRVRMVRNMRAAFVLLVACASGACGTATVAPPEAPAPTVLPEYTGTLLAASRIAALPTGERGPWDAYVLRSRQSMHADRALLEREMAAARIATVIRPPSTASDFAVSSSWTPSWLASTAGRTLVATVRSYQTASGGWGKHIDYAQGARKPGMGYNSESDEWAYVGTIDNGATINELRLLGLSAAAVPDTAVTSAFNRGVAWLVAAQFPSGCWPQVFPLMGSYHDAATHNDDAMVNVVRFLRDVAKGAFAVASVSARLDAASAVTRALSCIVTQQVMVQGRRTTWAQQHDPLTHAPVLGRSYEIIGLTGREGARVTDLLMEEAAPSSAMVGAVYAAVAFYRATAIPDVRYEGGTGLVPAVGSGPVWARLVEIGTNRPIFANRDGIVLYDFNLLTDRRNGYAWYGTEPSTTLRTFETWARTHPAPGS